MSNPQENKPRRRWQFSLRTLLIVMLLASVGLSWVTGRMRERQRQRATVEHLQRNGVGVSVLYEGERPEFWPESLYRGPAWLRSLLGEDFFSRVDRLWVDCFYDGVTDDGVTEDDLRDLPSLKYLRQLSVDGPVVSDSTLEYVVKLKRLDWLRLCHTKVTDAGLRQLQQLPGLQYLSLDRTKITDAGLGHLRPLTGLRELSLSHTRITDAGLEHLRGLRELRRLHLDRTGVSDEGLKMLGGFANLEFVNLVYSHVTPKGVQAFKAAHPRCQVEYK